MPLFEISVVIFLVLVNGVLAMAELAVVSARPARLRSMAERGSSGARAALSLAADPGLTIIAYTAPEHTPAHDALQQEAEQLAQTAVREAMGSDADTVECVVEEAPPVQALTTAARDADLLVVGSRGLGGFTGLLLGSVSTQCAQHAPCPVVIIRP